MYAAGLFLNGQKDRQKVFVKGLQKLCECYSNSTLFIENNNGSYIKYEIIKTVDAEERSSAMILPRSSKV